MHKRANGSMQKKKNKVKINRDESEKTKLILK